MVNAERRARKKANRGEKSAAIKRVRAEKHAKVTARHDAEVQEVDDFLGAPLPKKDETDDSGLAS